MGDALDEFAPTGDVPEIACGPGTWTPQLLSHAEAVTAVDSSPEKLAIAKQRVGGDERVRFVEGDLLGGWRPDRRYGLVFFGLWLSHVPDERFEASWDLVRECPLPPAASSYR